MVAHVAWDDGDQFDSEAPDDAVVQMKLAGRNGPEVSVRNPAGITNSHVSVAQLVERPVSNCRGNVGSNPT